MSRFRTRAALLAAALTLAPAALPAQSLLAARALGYPLDALDARSRALGYLRVGLPDPQLSLNNPAAAVGLPAPGVAVTVQGDEFSAEAVGQDQQRTTARFPAIQVGFPVNQRLVVSVGYAAMLDQNWNVQHADSAVLGGEMRRFTDRFSSRGGVARFRLGAGYRLLPRVDVGAAIDLYSGALRDSVARFFEPGTGLVSTQEGTTYQWEGLGFGAGARWRGSAGTVALALSGGGSLEAAPQDSGGVGKSYSLPLTADLGASARISQVALVAASLRWTAWGSADADLAASGGARDVLAAGLGVEYDAFRLLARRVPLRVGVRYAQLPFRWEDDGEFLDERAVTAGLGMLFSGGGAAMELAGERGMRGGSEAGLEESFWRLSFTLSLFGR